MVSTILLATCSITLSREAQFYFSTSKQTIAHFVCLRKPHCVQNHIQFHLLSPALFQDGNR